VAPTNVEKTFHDDEIIVSKTDTRGRITYVNDVFVHISGYSEHEVLGQPHSIIRHPDMPRAVFKLLWDTIQAGSEIFAYVKNMSAEGHYYWVLAHVTPTFDSAGEIVGYHSNRRTAHREAIAKIEPVYKALLAEEQAHSSIPEAIAASYALLADTLAAQGVTYDQFVWSLDDAGKVVAA
jgi:PAS domain S-box-containing protein